MPNYEYQCTACDNLFEIWQPVGEAAPACPQCGAVVKKVFHPPRVIFKGSGFYVTDLRAEKAGAASKSSVKPSANASGDNASEASSGGDAAKETSTENAKETPSADKSADKTPPAKSDNSAPAAPAK